MEVFGRIMDLEQFLKEFKDEEEIDISNEITFEEVCDFLEEISKSSPNHETVRKNYTNFNEFRIRFRNKCGLNLKPEDGSSSFYHILRCLVPAMDGRMYNIQVKTLIRNYAKAIQTNVGSLENQIRDLSSGRDIGDVLYDILKMRHLNKKTNKFTLRQINFILDCIANKQISTDTILSYLIENMSAREQKWLVRLILKKMKLGMGKQQILSALHPNATEFYNRCSDLKRLCLSIENNEIDLMKVVEPFSPIHPMLCERLDTKCLYDLLSRDVLYAEEKMDGERFHIHMKNNIWKYFSRNGKEFPKIEINLTPLLKLLTNQKVKNMILDGELMVWNMIEERFCTKGENIDVKSLPQSADLRPCYVVYDLLYLNDENLMEKPYLERVQRYQSILEKKVGVLHFVKRTQICTLSHFTDIFNAALDANEEGVVIKERLSKYQPNSRKGGWYKVKADYIAGLISDFDVLIMGGYFNFSKTIVDSYVVGVMKKVSQEYEIYSIGKVANISLSKVERDRLNDNVSSNWKLTAKNPPPTYMKFGGYTHQPDMWINPKESTILQIKASELAQSSSFGTPYALRFARIEAIRVDKKWDECMTLEEYEKFYQGDSRVKKIVQKHISDEDMVDMPRRRKAAKVCHDTSVYRSSFVASAVEKTSSIFEGFSFCVLSGGSMSDENIYSVDDLKSLIVKGRGTLVENPSPKDPTCICIVGKMTLRAQMLLDTNKYNIVSMSWLIETSKKGFIEIKARHFIGLSPELREEFQRLGDQYGDSYTDPVDEEDLKLLMKNLENSPLVNNLSELEKFEVEKKLNTSNFFRCKSGRFQRKNRKSLLAEALFKWHGGITNSSQINFIFVDPDDLDDLERFYMQLQTLNEELIQIASIAWILDSNREKKMLNIENYLITL